MSDKMFAASACGFGCFGLLLAFAALCATSLDHWFAFWTFVIASAFIAVAAAAAASIGSPS